MNTVFSNIAQAKITDHSLNKVWMDLFKSADEAMMATGYVSNDAIKELHKIIEHNSKLKKLDLLVGMHYLEGFTRPHIRHSLNILTISMRYAKNYLILSTIIPAGSVSRPN